MIETISHIQPDVSRLSYPNEGLVARDLIDIKEIKAILYLALRGDVALSGDEHKVDILI